MESHPLDSSVAATTTSPRPVHKWVEVQVAKNCGSHHSGSPYHSGSQWRRDFPATKARILSEILIITMYVLLKQSLSQPVPCKSLLYPQSDFALDQSFWSFFLLPDFLLSLSLARMISNKQEDEREKKSRIQWIRDRSSSTKGLSSSKSPIPSLWALENLHIP